MSVVGVVDNRNLNLRMYARYTSVSEAHALFYLALIIVIESVDSICRDSADTQYMLIQTNFSKSPKQLTFKPL